MNIIFFINILSYSVIWKQTSNSEFFLSAFYIKDSVSGNKGNKKSKAVPKKE